MKTRLMVPVFLLIMIAACNWSTPAPTSLAPTEPSTPAVITATVAPESVSPTPTPSLSPEPSPTASALPSATILPAWEWPRSSPEEQGLSSDKLAAMLEAIQQEKQAIHSVLVIRHGVLVLEAYVHPFNPETRHSVYSVTKSITSALVGITISEGLLGPVDTPVISYFPSVTLDDPRKASISIENLLAMDSGIEWTEPMYSGLNDLWGIIEAGDPAQYFFNPALLADPGTLFNYNSGGSHLLSMLVQEGTGQLAADFAAQRLFSPLDIRDTYWSMDFSGHSVGGTGLELLPSDMAKIGQVYLDGGQWQGQQVIPADWVSASTRQHSTPSAGMGYGYQWWIRPQGDYYALGWGGQQIRVFPQQDMVVIFTAGASGNAILHNDLVDNYLLPAAVSESPLPADPQAQARLADAINTLTSPQVWPSNPQSPLVSQVDGKQWLVTGMGNWSMFTLHFLNDREAQLDLTLDKEAMPLRVGLDGVYRVTDTNDCGPIALVGYWESPSTFVLVQQNLREADRRTTHLQFSGDAVKLFSEWIVEPHQEESEAVLFGN